jgi:hypothetical protein
MQRDLADNPFGGWAEAAVEGTELQWGCADLGSPPDHGGCRRSSATSPTSCVAVTSLLAAPTAAGAQITFSLSSAAQVQARVLNIAGRPVKILCHAKDCEAGTKTLLWNAQSDQGLPVPNGTYLVEVTAKTNDGSQVRVLSQLRIER